MTVVVATTFLTHRIIYLVQQLKAVYAHALLSLTITDKLYEWKHIAESARLDINQSSLYQLLKYKFHLMSS